MALPKVEGEVIKSVEGELQEEKLDKALALSGTGSSELAAPSVLNKHVDAAQVLRDQGFGEQELDFTSFPIVILNDGKFSTAENKGFGSEFNCIIHSCSDSFLYVADRGRDEDPLTAYSSDDIYVNGKEEPRKLIADQVKEWEDAGYPVDKKVYKMVMAEMLTEPHENEFVFIQVSPTSQGKLAGYLTSLVLRNKATTDVVTRVGVGAQVGSGIKAFNPYTFKMVRSSVAG